jgi:hypothetical protein
MSSLRSTAGSRNVPIIVFLRDTLLRLKHRRRPDDFVFVREDGSRILCLKEAFRAAWVDARDLKSENED